MCAEAVPYIHSFQEALKIPKIKFSTISCFPRSRIITKLLFFSHSCYLWKMRHSGNAYYTEKWQMLTPYGLVRNSFMNARYGRGSSGYFHIKNCVGIKDPRTSKIFLISPANLLQCKLWGFFCVLYVLNGFEELLGRPVVHGMSADGLWTLQTSDCSAPLAVLRKD